MATYSGSDKRIKYLFENGGGGGSSSLAGLSDVNLSSPTDGQVLTYHASSGKWINATGSAGGGVNYSTTEQVVGTWIDGKTIYQKTIVLNSEITISNTDWTSIGITASSLSIDRYIDVVAQTNSGTCWRAVSVATINGNIALTAWRNGDTIGVKNVTIQYTKSS